MIELKNLERSYKTAAGETWVLRRIDLTIPEGQFLTVMQVVATERTRPAR